VQLHVTNQSIFDKVTWQEIAGLLAEPSIPTELDEAIAQLDFNARQAVAERLDPERGGF
jgi:hypothetical protein